MNKEKKLEELERRQREIADEIKQLREKPEPHYRGTGDVYWHEDGTLLVADENKTVWLTPDLNGITGTIRHNAHGDPMLTDSFYLGKFDDVFITKKRVAEMLYNIQDVEGDTLQTIGNDYLCYEHKKLFAKLKAEGITPDLLK